QLAPYAHPGAEPIFELRSARSLVGDGQPVPAEVGETHLTAELGLAAVVAEELEAADAREAERAILGFTLLLDWTRPGRWQAPPGGREPPSQLGPFIATGRRLRELEATARIGERQVALGPVTGWRFQPAEVLA